MPEVTHRSSDPLACIELAGFAAAQTVCCLFDRIPLAPLAFSRRAAQPITVTLMSGGRPAELSARCAQWLDTNPDNADVAVVACDAYVTIAGVRRDAVVLDMRSYAPPIARMKIAVPYRPHHDPSGFAIHRPTFVVDAIEGRNTDAMTNAFFLGVMLHEAGRRVWNACADESCLFGNANRPAR